MTTSPERVEAEDLRLREWVRDAVSDGWLATATYPGHESITTAVRLSKEGWGAQAIIRGNPADSISVWGPDRLTVLVPIKYSWETLQEGLTTCQFCHKRNTPTVRISFAGRCCTECRAILAPKLEYPGWAS